MFFNLNCSKCSPAGGAVVDLDGGQPSDAELLAQVLVLGKLRTAAYQQHTIRMIPPPRSVRRLERSGVGERAGGNKQESKAGQMCYM